DWSVTGVQTCALPIFATAADRAVQIFAILISGVFLLSGFIYLYLGRVTWLLGGDFWSVYAFSWNHTWFQSALFKQAGHVTFFPRSEERRVGKECRSWW